MKQHPDRETLEKFISGQLSPMEARLTDRHIGACAECRDRADEVSEWMAMQLLDSWLRPGYGAAFERAADKAADRLAVIFEEGRNVEDLFSQLMREPESQRRLKIADESKFHNLKLCQLLRNRSRENWFLDPAAALKLADLAVEIARHLPAWRYGSNLVEDARALSWGCLGNSFRVVSDLWRAEKALQQAWLHHAHAGEDMLTETELLGFTASLRKLQGVHDKAEQLADQAIAIYREGQDTHLEASALIKKGGVLCYQHRYGDALAVTRAGIAQVDPGDARLLLIGKHNLMWALSQSGRPEEARRLMGENALLYEEPVDLARLHWLDGLIAKELGQLKKARKRLNETVEFFRDHNLGIEVFQASLSLAETYVQDKNRQQVAAVLGELIPLGEALGLRKEVFAARLLYEKASRA